MLLRIVRTVRLDPKWTGLHTVGRERERDRGREKRETKRRKDQTNTQKC